MGGRGASINTVDIDKSNHFFLYKKDGDKMMLFEIESRKARPDMLWWKYYGDEDYNLFGIRREKFKTDTEEDKTAKLIHPKNIERFMKKVKKDEIKHQNNIRKKTIKERLEQMRKGKKVDYSGKKLDNRAVRGKVKYKNGKKIVRADHREDSARSELYRTRDRIERLQWDIDYNKQFKISNTENNKVMAKLKRKAKSLEKQLR